MSHFGRSGPPDIRDTYSLLVLNISFRTNEDDLLPLFNRYGKVVDIFIPRNRRNGESRGFAFVRYRHSDEAQEAIHCIDGRNIDGRNISVQFAKYGRGMETIHKGRITQENVNWKKSSSRSPRPTREKYREPHRERSSGISHRSRSHSRSRTRSRSPGRRRSPTYGREGEPNTQKDHKKYNDRRGRGRHYRSRSRGAGRSLSPEPRRDADDPKMDEDWKKEYSGRNPHSTSRSLSPKMDDSRRKEYSGRNPRSTSRSLRPKMDEDRRKEYSGRNPRSTSRSLSPKMDDNQRNGSSGRYSLSASRSRSPPCVRDGEHHSVDPKMDNNQRGECSERHRPAQVIESDGVNIDNDVNMDDHQRKDLSGMDYRGASRSPSPVNVRADNAALDDNHTQEDDPRMENADVKSPTPCNSDSSPKKKKVISSQDNRSPKNSFTDQPDKFGCSEAEEPESQSLLS